MPIIPVSQWDAELLGHAQIRFNSLIAKSPIYNFLLSDAEITSEQTSLTTARLKLTKNHLNSKGGIHGSVSATFVDCFGGLAIASYDGREKTGASVDINVSYLGSASEGDEIEIEGKVDRVGGSLAFTTVTIRKIKADGSKEVIVLGRHTKFVRGTAPVKET